MPLLIISIFAAIIALVIIIVKYINKLEIKKETSKKNSPLYKKIRELNERYKSKFVYQVKNDFYYNPQLKSKRGLENFDILKHVKSQINDSISFYSKNINSIKENISLVSLYKTEYGNIKFTTEKEFEELKLEKIKYKLFHKCEKQIYESSSLKLPPQKLTIRCYAEYTSPAGKSHYYKDKVFQTKEVEKLINEVLNEISVEEQERLLKERKAEERREKERKLRELDKLDKNIQQREIEIVKKEKEFNEATQNHIYTTQNILVEDYKKEESIQNTKTLYQKLVELKNKFNNGLISYDEYARVRKELLRDE